ncbi:MAG TPA: DUF2269 family protein [Actinomycetota bacterium]|nr:DUF2269 family protein [Actinomycetota bacterium]
MLGVVTSYTILKTFHVIFAVIWVGGAFAINILGTRAAASNDGPRMAAFARETEWVGTHVYLPSSLLLLILGISAVLVGHLGFGHAWIILGLIGIGITIVTGSTFLGPESRRLSELIDRRGSSDPEVGQRLGRLIAVSRIDLVVLFLVVVDMVLKPGA